MDYREQLKKDNKILETYNNKMTLHNYQSILSDIYKYVKKVSEFYLEDDDISFFYESLILSIILSEEKVKSQKILDIPIYFDMFDKKDFILDQIVQDTREYLLKEHKYIGYKNQMIDVDFTDDCKKASEYIKKLCNSNKIWCHIIKITPGYDEKFFLFDGTGYHYACIVKYNRKYYLVDATYSQFFYAKRNNIDRLGVMGISGCGIGTFMLMNKERESTARKIIEKGYIELDKNILKCYLDGFTLSFRNGLYYEKTNDFSYTTPYTVYDYINFLTGSDSQVKHEGKDSLGFQRKLLENPYLKFRR